MKKTTHTLTHYTILYAYNMKINPNFVFILVDQQA